jgi:NADPH-dependent 7-cyano-7-deazaguanine reductase QueF
VSGAEDYKMYLLAYRNLGIFQRTTNRILQDVVRVCEPVWASVMGEFTPGRGCIQLGEHSRGSEMQRERSGRGAAERG